MAAISVNMVVLTLFIANRDFWSFKQAMAHAQVGLEAANYVLLHSAMGIVTHHPKSHPSKGVPKRSLAREVPPGYLGAIEQKVGPPETLSL